MSFPPRLVGHRTHEGTLILELGDGTSVPVETSAGKIEHLFGRPIGALCSSRTVEVYFDSIQMSQEEWAALSGLLESSQVGASPRLANLLVMSHEALARLPQRVYGGTANGTTLYLSLPMNFKRKPDGRLYALLNDGDQLHKTWVIWRRGRSRFRAANSRTSSSDSRSSGVGPVRLLPE